MILGGGTFFLSKIVQESVFDESHLLSALLSAEDGSASGDVFIELSSHSAEIQSHLCNINQTPAAQPPKRLKPGAAINRVSITATLGFPAPLRTSAENEYAVPLSTSPFNNNEYSVKALRLPTCPPPHHVAAPGAWGGPHGLRKLAEEGCSARPARLGSAALGCARPGSDAINRQG